MPLTETITIGGIPVHPFTSFDELLNQIFDETGQVQPGFAVAINPEKIILARQSSDIQAILQAATLRYADGIGVAKLMQRRAHKALPRLPGCELWESVMARAAEHKTPVFLVGGQHEVNQQVKEKLEAQFGCQIVGNVDGFFADEAQLMDQIVASGARIVTVAMGSPRQEQFILRLREKLPTCFYMGVGGTYDVFTENVQRAPKFFRDIGLEWFYRLLSQPTRIGRHTRLIKFVLLALSRRI